MTTLKVTEVQAKDVVEAGQVRLSSKGIPVLIVDAKDSPADGTDEYPFVAIRLNYFDINTWNGCESSEEILEYYPILLDAEMTYKEAK